MTEIREVTAMRGTTNGRSVVVAVSRGGSGSAVRFGAGEAFTEGCPLHLVHVVGLHVDQRPGRAARTTACEPSSHRRAEWILSQAVDRARDLVEGDVEITSELFHGDLVEGIEMVGRGASLVVLQRRSPGARRAAPGSTSAKVASQVSVPIACVPSDWDGARGGTVTVGVDDPLTCAPLLREAVQAARTRGSGLRVVHVAWPPEGDDARGQLEAALLEAVRGSSAVDASIQIVSGRAPGPILVEAMRTSDLMVVGRHHPHVPGGSQLGPVARRVLRDAACPVLLLTPTDSRSSAEWVFVGHLD